MTFIVERASNDLDIVITGKDIQVKVYKRFYDIADKDHVNLRRIINSSVNTKLYDNIIVSEHLFSTTADLI